MKKKNLELYVELNERALRLDGDVQGKEIEFTLYGNRMRISFPKFTYNSKSDTHGIEPFDNGLLLNWHDNAFSTNKVISYELKPHGVMTFKMTAFLISSFDAITTEVAEELVQAIPSWIDSFLDSIEISLFLDLTNNDFEVEQGTVTWAYLTKKEEKPIQVKSTSSINMQINDLPAISYGDLLESLDNLENGYIFDAEYFLIEGLRYFNKKLYRQSLIELATAVELCLADLLQIELQDLDLKQKELIFNKYNNLHSLREALNKLDIEVSNDIERYIGKPRNDAVHKGLTPSKDDTERALKLAKEFIYNKLKLTVE